MVKASVLSGRTTRRLVVNFRVDARVIRKLLPAGLEPRLVGGHGIAGISFARIEDVRAKFLPISFGVASDSVMHRIAVAPGGSSSKADRPTAAYVPRRDTSSMVDSLIRDRETPVERARSRFDVEETDGAIELLVRSYDDRMEIRLNAEEAESWPESSLFRSIGEAVSFFGDTQVRELADDGAGLAEGSVRRRWVAQPLVVHRIESSFFDDPTLFPPGSFSVDHALSLWNIGSVWHPAPDLHGGRLFC